LTRLAYPDDEVRRLLRRYLPSIVALVIAAVIVPLAVADHRNKQSRMNRAEVAEWYCTHRAVRCNGPSSARIEDRWNKRQVAYEVALAVLVTFAILQAVVHRPIRT
jgi:hypothetical protein